MLQERMQIKHLQGETERLEKHSTISPLPQMIPPIFTGSAVSKILFNLHNSYMILTISFYL